MKPKRIKILDVPLDCVDMASALEYSNVMLSGDQAHTIIALNPEKVIKAQTDPLLYQRLMNASLIIPDGIGVVIAAKLLNGINISRVPGSELMPQLCNNAAKQGNKIFLYGGSPNVSDRTVAVLQSRYSGLNIVGFAHGFLAESDMPNLIKKINASKAEILFVALGSPKQEQWMEKYLPQLNVKICQGVGGTFDVISGKVNRAPEFFRHYHLEWFYRLISQPKRIYRQTALPRFAWQVLTKTILRKVKHY